MKLTKLYLDQTGLAVFLGGKTQELVYNAVLEHAGSIASIRAYCNARLPQPLAYTTVATIANKLCSKGILQRKNIKQYKPEYRYTIRLDQEALIKDALQQLLEKLLREYPEMFNAILADGI